MESRAWTYILSLPEGPSQPEMSSVCVSLSTMCRHGAWCARRHDDSLGWCKICWKLMPSFSIVLFLLPIWHIEWNWWRWWSSLMVVRLLWINVTCTVWSIVWKVYGWWGGMAPSLTLTCDSMGRKLFVYFTHPFLIFNQVSGTWVGRFS